MVLVVNDSEVKVKEKVVQESKKATASYEEGREGCFCCNCITISGVRTAKRRRRRRGKGTRKRGRIAKKANGGRQGMELLVVRGGRSCRGRQGRIGVGGVKGSNREKGKNKQ